MLLSLPEFNVIPPRLGIVGRGGRLGERWSVGGADNEWGSE